MHCTRRIDDPAFDPPHWAICLVDGEPLQGIPTWQGRFAGIPGAGALVCRSPRVSRAAVAVAAARYDGSVALRSFVDNWRAMFHDFARVYSAIGWLERPTRANARATVLTLPGVIPLRVLVHFVSDWNMPRVRVRGCLRALVNDNEIPMVQARMLLIEDGCGGKCGGRVMVHGQSTAHAQLVLDQMQAIAANGRMQICAYSFELPPTLG